MSTETSQKESNQGIYQGLKFERASFQLEACRALRNGENPLVVVPTGSGKTVVALDAIALHLGKRGHIIYTAPIKALSLQIYNEFSKIFGREIVGLLTGDNKINTGAKILIMTTEILRNSMFRQEEKEKEISMEIYQWTFNPKEISLIIFDEVHFLYNKSRGHVWNDTIQKAPENIQLVMLSATFDANPTVISWFNQKERTCRLIKRDKRPVPLTFNLYDGTKNHIIYKKMIDFFLQNSLKFVIKIYLINFINFKLI